MTESTTSRPREPAARTSTAAGSGLPARVRQASPWLHGLAAAGVGALNTLSFAPTQHGGWLEIALFTLFYLGLLRTRSWRGALATAWAFGFGQFVTGVWWLYVSMHTYGGMPAALAGAAVALFAVYLGAWPALAGVLWSFATGHARRASAPGWHAPAWRGALAFASAWALGEWLRGTVLTGFPWLASGYAQVDGPLAGFAPLGGVYGVGWVLAGLGALLAYASNGALERALAARRGAGAALAVAAGVNRASAPTTAETADGADPAALATTVGEAGAKTAAENVSAPATATIVSLPPAGTAFAAFLLAVALCVAGLLLSQVAWTTPSGRPLDVRLLQGNIPQDMKFDDAGVDAALEEFQKLITERPADLVVTSETALPMLPEDLPLSFAKAVRAFADDTHTALLFGAFGGKVGDDGTVTDYTNSLYGVTPGQSGLYRYDKHHLVPFGEFIPWGFGWFIDLMKIPLGDLLRGPAVQPPFVVHGQPVSPDICYEDIFGDEIARTLRESAQPARILINSTNLGWFGNTIALEQHLQIARMRALETGRPMLVATNTGASGAIDPHGRMLGQLPSFTVGALDVRVEGTTGFTPYVMTGDWGVLASSLALLVACFSISVKRAKVLPKNR